MSDSFDLTDVDHVTVATVGPPGQRVFYLQARGQDQWVTVKIEKLHAAALADSVQRLLADLPQPGPLPDDPGFVELEPAFVVGELGLAYDAGRDRVLLVAEELVIVPEDADGLDDLDLPVEGSVARLALTREQAAGVAIRCRLLVESGRPPCPVCGRPLEPEGHSCPRLNGHRPPAR